MRLTFSVNMQPKCKGRPRFSYRHFSRRVYTPKTTVEAEIDVAVSAQKEMKHQKAEMIKGKPIRAQIDFFFKMPNSWNQTKRNANFDKPAQNRKDLDNLVKLVLDACNGIVYDDDHNVTEIVTHKTWASRDWLHISFETIENET